MNFKEDWNNRVLIADDQDEIHQDFEEMLNPGLTKLSTDQLARAFGSDVNIEENFLPKLELIHASSGEEAFNIVKESKKTDNPIAVIFLDVRMPPGWDGVKTTYKIREIDKNIEIVIMTAYSTEPLSGIIKNIELLYKLLYVRKPFAREEIQQMTISLVEKWNVEKELAARETYLKEELRIALEKLLNGYLPICAECKQIRDDDGNWDRIDAYIQKHTDAKFTYGICPECRTRLYPEIYDELPDIPASETKTETLKSKNSSLVP